MNNKHSLSFLFFRAKNQTKEKKQYRCQLRNFRAKKETFFEAKKKQNKSINIELKLEDLVFLKKFIC